jgi:hypothetical protein
VNYFPFVYIPLTLCFLVFLKILGLSMVTYTCNSTCTRGGDGIITGKGDFAQSQVEQKQEILSEK